MCPKALYSSVGRTLGLFSKGLPFLCEPRTQFIFIAVLAALLMIVPGAALGQSYLTAIGNTTFSTVVPVEQGVVNVANGDLHLSIPLGTWPQRGGHPVSAALVYDSRIWAVANTGSFTWQPTNVLNSQGGWRLVTNPMTGSSSFAHNSQTDNCPTLPSSPDITKSGHYEIYSNFQWTAPDGTLRTFPITTRYDPNNCAGGNITTGDALATDSSGYHLYITNYTTVASIYDPDGSTLGFKDSNGNFLSTDSNGNLIDTLGRTLVTVTTTCNGNSSETCFDVLTAQGTSNTSRYIVTTESLSVSTAFGQSGVTEYSGNMTVVQSIQLPDGTSYQFSYDYGGSGTYGELTNMTMPTGGGQVYSYTTFFDAFGKANRWLNTLASAGGTWTYTPAVDSPCTLGGYSFCQHLTLAKPSGDKVIYYFGMNSGTNGSWLGEALYQSASSTLVEVVTTWTSGPLNVQKLSQTTYTDDSASPYPTKSIQYAYANNLTPQIAKISEWNYYPQGSQPSTPDRVTNITYYSGGTNILDRQTSITVTNGAGTQTISQTNITYDSYGSNGLTSITGVTHHDDTNFGQSFTARGNPTQVQRCTAFNGSTCSNSVTTSMTYDTTGQVLSVTDPAGNVRTMNYADNFYNDNGANPPSSYTPSAPANAYLKSINLPIIGAQTFGYYFGTGQLAMSTDQNSATTYRHYVDSFSRPTESVFADGGWNAESYPSETEGDSFLGITNTTPSTSCTTGCRHNEVTTDALGRVNFSYLVSDPEGETKVQTAYDTSSRVYSVTNPYRATSTGQDNYGYDGLNRTTTVTHADGTAVNIYYGNGVTSHGGIATQLCSTSTYGLGYQALTLDEAGKKREVWTDGFGRTVEVDEPDSNNSLTKNTCYAHDLNNNLTQVVSATSQARTYQYDALSRLTSVATPETKVGGTQYSTTYSYVSGSSPCSGNPSAVCVRTNPTGVTATYTFDALNRVTQVKYSDTTPTVTYCYDGSNTACISGGFSSSNGKGRRTAIADGSGNCGWSYDAMGRVVTERKTIVGVTKTISYSHNLDGSVASITYPSGRKVTYTVSNAQRPLSATDSNGSQYAITASYAPMGALSSVIYGQVSGGFAGTTEARAYNTRLEQTSITASSSNGTALSLTYCFDAFSSNTCSTSSANNNGSVTGITNSVDTNETQTISYDNLNRVLSAATKSTSGNDCWGQSFGVDAVANLTSMSVTQCSAGSLSVSTDGNNHLTDYGYDHAGDMTGDGSYTYAYDAESRITSANGVSYLYDGDGLRVKKSSGTLYWRGAAGETLSESDLNGNITNEYVFFAGRRIARISGSTVNYFYADALGTVHTITDATGHACYDATFTPYGQEMLNPNITQTCSSNYKFTGYEYDSETGLYYGFARYYNPRLGRFMSTDALAGGTGNPQSQNSYAYVINNPANMVDPLGLKGGCDVAGMQGGGRPFSYCADTPFGGGSGDDGCTMDFTSAPCSLESGASGNPCPDSGCGPGSSYQYVCEPTGYCAYIGTGGEYQCDAANNCGYGMFDNIGLSTSDDNQAECSAEIQATVQADLNPKSLVNLGPTSGPGMDSNGMRGGAYNVNFFVTGVNFVGPGPNGQFGPNAVPGANCGRFDDGLHIPIPNAPACPELNDPTIFTGQSTIYNGQLGFFLTAHIDSGNANTFFGAIKHVSIDLILPNLGYNHGC
ncbi:MAG TPA: RHS repeat-associated core domain-containing protein [Candidatus Acidoferrales bacterium]|nr:RHS repeat-associated core domain-containing protein [Candidatus Acidoferrales bacterium]